MAKTNVNTKKARTKALIACSLAAALVLPTSALPGNASANDVDEKHVVITQSEDKVQDMILESAGMATPVQPEIQDNANINTPVEGTADVELTPGSEAADEVVDESAVEDGDASEAFVMTSIANIVTFNVPADVQVQLASTTTFSHDQHWVDTYEGVFASIAETGRHVLIDPDKDECDHHGYTCPTSYSYALKIGGKTYKPGDEQLIRVGEGENMKAYLLDFNHSKNNVNISLKEFNFAPGTDQTLNSILGEGMNFGIIANTATFGGHLESNFAIGTLVSTNGNQQAPKNEGGPAHISLLGEYLGEGLIYELNGNKGKTCIFTTPESYDRFHSNMKTEAALSKVKVDTNSLSGDEIKKMVSDMLDYVNEMSAEMMAEPVQIPYKHIRGDNDTIDLKSFGPGTYYISFEPGEFATIGNQFSIHINDDQKVVLNIPDSEVTLNRFTVHGSDQVINTAGYSSYVPEHVIFNMPNAVKAGNSGGFDGMVLLPNGTWTAGGPASGWLIADVIASVGGQEWHFCFPHIPEYNFGDEEKPEPPVEPEGPVDPETPVEPETPETPDKPTEPETPETPDKPGTPLEPEGTPDKPETPEPETPETPETPEPGNPEEPGTQPEPEGTPDKPGTPNTPEVTTPSEPGNSTPEKPVTQQGSEDSEKVVNDGAKMAQTGDATSALIMAGAGTMILAGLASIFAFLRSRRNKEQE